MPNILLSAYAGEGETDGRFFGPLIERTVADILQNDSDQQIDVYEPEWLGTAKGADQMVAVYQTAHQHGAYLLILHADTDGRDSAQAKDEKVKPALDRIADLKLDSPPVVVPLLPVQETEAWMLADRDVLREVLGTQLSDQELNLYGDPERYADPKGKLNEALRVVKEGKGPHLRVDISSLYNRLGQVIPLESLNRLPSYQRFRADLVEALQQIGYLKARPSRGHG